jgi:hypothetical protein
MRGVSRKAQRAAGVMAVLTLLAAPTAFAVQDGTDSRGWLIERIQQAKRFIVVAFSRLGTPPG